jgi:hypothetical protein
MKSVKTCLRSSFVRLSNESGSFANWCTALNSVFDTDAKRTLR